MWFIERSEVFQKRVLLPIKRLDSYDVYDEWINEEEMRIEDAKPDLLDKMIENTKKRHYQKLLENVEQT